MKVVVLDEADAELSAAADWYEQEREGLGDELLAEADRVLNAIAASPNTWAFAPGSKVVRRFLFTRFPYGLFRHAGGLRPRGGVWPHESKARVLAGSTEAMSGRRR
jgi:hypothetical protein